MLLKLVRYTGLNKPVPPESAVTAKVPTLATVAKTAIILNRAKERNFEFLKSVPGWMPEYSWYNTKKGKKRNSIIAAKD